MYNMYLAQEALVLKFPELPEEIDVKCEIDNKKYNVLALGDVINTGEKGLKNFNIKSFFPSEDAEIYIKKIETMISNRKPMRFILRRNDKVNYDNSNIHVLIDEFSYKEEGGENDISFSLKFTEFREFKAKEINNV